MLHVHVAEAQTGLCGPGCPYDGGFTGIISEPDCSGYHYCVYGESKSKIPCQEGTLFDPVLQVCTLSSTCVCDTPLPTVQPTDLPNRAAMSSPEPNFVDGLFDVAASAAGFDDDTLVDAASSFIGDVYEDDESPAAPLSYRPTAEDRNSTASTRSAPDTDEPDGEPEEKPEKEGYSQQMDVDYNIDGYAMRQLPSPPMSPRSSQFQLPNSPARSASYTMGSDIFGDSFPEYNPAAETWIEQEAPSRRASMSDLQSPPRMKRVASKRNMSILSNASDESIFYPRQNSPFRVITPETSPSTPDRKDYQLALVKESPSSRDKPLRKSRRYQGDDSSRTRRTSDKKSSSSRHEKSRNAQRKSRRGSVSSSRGDQARTSSSRRKSSSSRRDLTKSRSSRNLVATENAIVPYNSYELVQYNAPATPQARAMVMHQAEAMQQAQAMQVGTVSGLYSNERFICSHFVYICAYTDESMETSRCAA